MSMKNQKDQDPIVNLGLFLFPEEQREDKLAILMRFSLFILMHQ